MAIQDTSTRRTVIVDTFTDGVLARDDREHRSQCGREVRLVLGEPGEQVADGGALSELDSLQRRRREAREPSAETHPNRQLAASLTARREYRRDVSGVAAARATTWRVPTTNVATRARVIAV
jgi:hypothetical protein